MPTGAPDITRSRPRHLRRLALVTGFALACGAGTAADHEVVRIGVLAYQGSETSETDWSHLTARLNGAIPARRFELRHYDLDGMREAVGRQQLDFVVTNGGQYVILENELGLSRIVTLASSTAVSPDRAIGSAVIARSSRDDLRQLTDLAGKGIAAVSPEAFGGYLVALREFNRAGVMLEDGDARVVFLGLPMQRIVDAVAKGEADAGIVRACLIESLAAKGIVSRADFKVIGAQPVAGFPCGVSSALYPDWPLAKARHTDLALAKAVATALLSMPPTAEGTSWSVPADYLSVHELYRELQTGPYAYLREVTPEGLARRYWPYLLAAFLALAGFIVHLVRVEYLVKRRTAELSEALAARNAAEARMRTQQEQADHLARLSILGELAGTLAHELNQPLTTIGTYAQSLQRRVKAGQIDAAAFVEANREIAAQAERAGGIIQRIRAFARKRAPVRERRSPADLVRESAALFSGMLPEVPPVVVENDLPPDAAVSADPLQVQQVLLNLLKNAADATRALPAERRSITLRIERDGAWYRICVHDRGPGLSDELRARLFEPFFTTKPDGMGLGLSICKTIAEAHGGRLWAESHAEGPGLAFCFTLPDADHAE